MSLNPTSNPHKVVSNQLQIYLARNKESGNNTNDGASGNAEASSGALLLGGSRSNCNRDIAASGGLATTKTTKATV